jgi:hypothetical protein
MRDSNHTDEFEEYLQQQVSEHRMYPSDRVWKNIRNSVHTPKKWPALSVFSVLIISSLVIGTILNKPLPDSVTPNFVYSLQSPANVEAQKSGEVIKSSEQAVDNNYSINQLTSRTIIEAVEKIKIDEAVAMQLTRPESFPAPGNSSVNSINYLQTPVPFFADLSSKAPDKNQLSLLTETASNSPVTFKNIDNYFFDVTSRIRSILNSEPVQNSKGGISFFTSGKNEIAYDNFDLRVPPEHRDLLPSLNQLGKNSSRFDFRFYITPSVSYRRLKEKNQPAVDNKTPGGASLEADYRIDPSVAINQSPAMGYETGFGLGYKLNKKFSLTGGFQFNISQYKINAFLYKDEPIAVVLDKGEYSSTVNTVSSLRSVSGTTPLTIKNRYYQISMPLGLEWNILNHGRLSWGLGASAQPTYTFDKQPLIISSNYKNYADGSAYVRNWNINANVETFLGYSMGTYRWQIGPQLRYQMLPSLMDKYPNKEYLFNYGLKVGIVKKLK